MPPDSLMADKASAMLDRLEQAVIDYERAAGPRVSEARREAAEARKALFAALTGGGNA